MLDVAIYERQTPLTVNNAEYEKRCGSGSPPDHVCFTFLAGDASNVDVSITKGEFAYPATDVLVKDDAYHDFTIDDTSKSFSMYWMDTHVMLIYNPIATKKGCYNLQVMAPDDSNARIWVNDGILGEGIDLDSDQTDVHSRDFCTKWIRPHVANDRKSPRRSRLLAHSHLHSSIRIIDSHAFTVPLSV
ncbi:uncharacterized protein PSANT_00730 [Moesziomyces antarcticus]|uniref:Uncharacterized protein n=1 Tax=Pseudozyma antarctica TaxID=84753 RepID=A0A5C3FFW2_PSEA2|nr:uncharacterized protein PSANT_00730 [Moesziomyces antarcticus]